MPTRSTSPSGSRTFNFIAALALLGCGNSTSPPSGPSEKAPRYADLVLRGGVIITGDAGQPRATAVAVRGGVIAAVGDDQAVARLTGERTRVIELRGRAVTAGLVDGHAHLYGLGKLFDGVSLRGLDSEQACVEALVAAAARRGPGEWLTGRNWDQNRWTPRRFPTAASLDARISDRPVAVRRVDGHALWVNSVALARAGIDRKTKDPSGGRIVRDSSGKPTGVLIDNAIDLVEKHIPKPTSAVIRRRILAAAAEAVRHGLTGVHEMGINRATAGVYRALAAQGKLPLRVYAYLAGDSDAKSLIRTAPRIDGDFFVMRSVKFFADGALGSRGARLLVPYSDAPKSRGLWINTPQMLRAKVELAVRNGWQVAIHAIGDAANRAVLDAYEAVLRAHPGDRRLRVEHAQILSPQDLPRFAALGIIASMQPTHATSDMPWASDRVGPERIAGAYAWRSILDSGARLVAGSDFPVEKVPPLQGIYAAVTRQDKAGKPAGGWIPGQRMTLDEALEAFTAAPAFASFADKQRGRLREGYAADITVYDRKLAAGASLLETQIDYTIVGGRIVFQRK